MIAYRGRVRYLTDFADQAVILPLVLAVAIALAVQGWRRGAIVWLVVVAGVFGATLASKLMFLACSPVFGPIDVHSPSGQDAAAGDDPAGGGAGGAGDRGVAAGAGHALAAGGDRWGDDRAGGRGGAAAV